MTKRRLIYLTTARLPTEKAHGYQIVKVCEAMARLGLEVELWHPRRHQPNPALQQQTAFAYYGVPPTFRVRSLPNIDVVRLDPFLPPTLFSLLFTAHGFVWGLAATALAKSRRADLYYTRDPILAFLSVVMSLPTIYEAHLVPLRAGRWFLRAIGKRSTRTRIVALTRHTRDRLVTLGIPSERIAVQPDAVDLDMFQSLPSQSECRRKHSLPFNRPIIGYVGRFQTLEMEKGIPELIAAAALLGASDKDGPILLIVGGPMEAVPLYLEVARSVGLAEDRLRFVDRVPTWEVPTWMRACDILTLPYSTNRTFYYSFSPLKLFEYMAAGVPIVASDLPALREILRDGENALLVEPGNPTTLAQAISRLLADEELMVSLSRRAEDDVQCYTWERRADAILRLAPYAAPDV
jgi:glycosyltransferase involved in cell wall biosynthesis